MAEAASKAQRAHLVHGRKRDQAGCPRIARPLSPGVRRGVRTQFDAVQRQIIWVVDHLRYINPPRRYDALYALDSGRGNCQNFSHLTAALLRACGIPVRIVNGFTLDKPFDVIREYPRGDRGGQPGDREGRPASMGQGPGQPRKARSPGAHRRGFRARPGKCAGRKAGLWSPRPAALPAGGSRF
ncbi:MAG: transglutaminase domain-containing protein [Deltaproteobacteria bacterium]|nr:transglutaminase domain-containing protein [Deltaproteobacteria bacterium]